MFLVACLPPKGLPTVIWTGNSELDARTAAREAISEHDKLPHFFGSRYRWVPMDFPRDCLVGDTLLWSNVHQYTLAETEIDTWSKP